MNRQTDMGELGIFAPAALAQSGPGTFRACPREGLGSLRCCGGIREILFRAPAVTFQRLLR